jgi:hypothetical protein
MTRATIAIVRVFMVCLRAGRDQLATLLRFADRFDPPNGVRAESKLVARATFLRSAVSASPSGAYAKKLGPRYWDLNGETPVLAGVS